jgi:hypothetical protein
MHAVLVEVDTSGQPDAAVGRRGAGRPNLRLASVGSTCPAAHSHR